MTVQEIRDIAIDSATHYYNYLVENNLGIQIVGVSEIEYYQSKDFILKLRLSAKLFDIDSIFFKLNTNDQLYDSIKVKVLEYDSDKNIILIKILPEDISDFSNLHNRDINIISDLRFLVQRVKLWYEMNGSKIAIPTKSSSLRNSYKNLKYINGKFPSENQKESLTNIFTNPFSYIWGAPGTGKTQFVLAYAALHYISKNKRIAILAPTNNSIEQVLKGVISMMDLDGIERAKIIRLGTPSRKFAESYPEVCEEKGVQKKLDEVDKQINILERILIYKNSKKTIEYTKHNILEFEKIENLQAEVISSKEILDKSKKEQKRTEIDIKYIEDDIQKLSIKRQLCQKSIDSFGYKLKNILLSKETKKVIEISFLENSITNKSKEKDFLKYTFDEIQNEIDKKTEIYQKVILERDNFIRLIKSNLSIISYFKEIITELNDSNYDTIKSKLTNAMDIETSKLEIDEYLLGEYKTYTFQQLQDKLFEYTYLRKKLALSSTEERIKHVGIIACTLDSYIGRYTESKLNVEHIFLDEAGYANIIKALTLFNQDIPITFLGDHMQLPPVCEINDTKINTEDEYKNLFIWSQSAIYLETLFIETRDVALLQYLKNLQFNPLIISKTSLNSTFRFGFNLSKILGRHVYDKDFTSSNPTDETKITFINAKKIEPYKSRISINEVIAIVKLTNQLKLINNDYVILTPYKYQVKLLGIHLPQEQNDLKIITVHGSQGREWDTVILSVVDTSDMWFVDSTQKLSKGLNLINTAVSRAKNSLIIVCDKEYWLYQNGQLITDLINAGTELEI